MPEPEGGVRHSVLAGLGVLAKVARRGLTRPTIAG